ncbi:MAG TPA: hypothetical protein VJV03_14040 [Pyrinomonadaceae bacterium]|nr:hypothetical protein [Pyrinomonadaceae bacterium]
MADSDNPSIEIHRSFNMPGYVLDAPILRRIDAVCRESVSQKSTNGARDLEFICYETTADDQMISFESLDVLIKHLDGGTTDPEILTIQYSQPERAGIHLDFLKKGQVHLVAYSKSLEFRFNIEQLSREIRRSDQEYGWAIRTFIFKPYLVRTVKLLLVLVSVFLLANSAYYLYARKVGVNIDPNVIPKGNEYAVQVEEAIKTQDTAEKLNVLLVGQLQYFTNVRDVLMRQERIIIASVAMIVVLIISIGLRKMLVNLYPLSFFAFETQKPALIKLVRKREILGVAVIIGFVVNLVAGLVIAIFTR